MPTTEELFRADAYQKSCDATVFEVNGRGGVVLDRSVFYAAGGGQPGDAGMLGSADGFAAAVATTVYGDSGEIVHVLGEDATRPAVGDVVTATLNWPRRHRHMRMHTALHLLSVLLPYPVTGGQIGVDEGRLDFDIPEAGLDKDALTEELARLIAADHPVSDQWITDAELDQNPGLVKTMSVQPPRGAGKVRLIKIGDIDLQPCGGTHVASTAEIGDVFVAQLEKKGRQNRRVRLRFRDAFTPDNP
ncbi:MAG: alanyl-tRNA editing protein [Hyphomicrobiales bacterium]|nr:alanyl-tRNA editing protein [Hyphomicrobiales bacterium]